MSDQKRTDGGEEDDGEIDVTSLVLRALELSESAMEGEGEDEAEMAEVLNDLQAVVDEADELLDAMDLTELPSAIDAEDADEVIDEENLPEAIANLDPQEAIRLRKLLAVVDIGELWDSVDVRDVWRNKREFEEALEELDETDDEDVLPFVDDLTDDDDGFIDDLTDDEDDDGFVDVDMDGDGMMDGDGLLGDEGDDAVDVPDEAYQTAVQSQLSNSVDEFRDGLVAVHQKLARLREENQERVDRTGQPNSRNPTAHSTLTSGRGRSDVDTRYSTVPTESKYSNAPNRPRIYGSRFEKHAEEEEEDDA